MDGDRLLVFNNEYGFGSGERGYDGVGFLWLNILKNRLFVAKGRVNGVNGISTVVVGFFETEGDG